MRIDSRTSTGGRQKTQRAGAGDARAWPVAAVVLVALVCAPGVSTAGEVPHALREAVEAHPGFAALLTDYTFQRSVTATARVLDSALHEFLLSHPDVGATVARVQGFGEYRVRRVGADVFEGTDGEGVTTVLRILSEAPGRRVFHARGRYAARFLPVISGEALVLVTTRYEDTGDAEMAHGRLSVYASLDNRVLGWLLQILTPLLGGVLDAKIAKAFLSESRAIGQLARDPDALLARLGEDESLAPADVAAFSSLLRNALARRPGAWAGAARKPRDQLAGGANRGRGSEESVRQARGM